MYSGIAKTYLRGETGPGIYDLDLFPKTKPIYDDNNLADSYKEIESKLVLLCGEYIQFIGNLKRFKSQIEV